MNIRKLYIFTLFLLIFYSSRASTGRQYLEKGMSYVAEDNFPMAMKYFTKSMETAEREGDKRSVAVSMGYVGNVYYNLYDYARCLQYQTKGYDMAVRLGDNDLQCNFLTNIVATYCKLNNATKAREYYAIQEKMKPGRKVNVFSYYLIYNRARIAFVEGDYTKALEYHRQALAYAEEHKMPPAYRLYQYCEMGQIYLAQGDFKSALSNGAACEKEARRLGMRDLLTSVLLLMADSYGGVGDTVSETAYRTQYFALSDSLFSRKFVSQADNDLMEYETRRTSEQIHSLNDVITYQVFAIAAASVFVVVLALMLFLLWRNNRKLKTARLILLDKNRELQRQDDNTRRLLEQWSDAEHASLPADRTEDAPQPAGTVLTDSSNNAAHEKDATEEAGRKATDEQKSASVALSKEQANILLNRIVKVMGDISVISNPDFSLNMLAEAVGSNTRYVSWVINDTYSKNFKTLLNEQRIREVCRRLADSEHYGNVTIQAIYESVGYTNAVSFIRAFRKINGMTPSEYQSLVAEGDKNDDRKPMVYVE